MVARFSLKIKQLRGQKDVDNLIQTDNKLFWKIHPQHVSLTLQCCSLTTLSKWTISFSAINLKRSLYMTKHTQFLFCRYSLEDKCQSQHLIQNFYFYRDVAEAFTLKKWISTRTQILKLSSTQQNLAAVKINRHTKASSVNFTFFFPPYAFNRNYGFFLSEVKIT